LTTFDDLGLGSEVLRAVADAGYREPTPIQAQAIPVVLQGRDVLGCAQTGTGKTAAFTLPMIEVLSQGRAKARMPRSLVLSPTRELAMQTAENFDIYGKHHALTMALLIGGVALDDQTRKLERGVDVLIATPGRLLDHFERGALLLNGVKILVIDEADRMLDMGFMPDVERIVGLLPPLRQTLMFSATMPPEIRRLANTILHNAKEIRVTPPASPADTVEHFLVRATARSKRRLLEGFLRTEAVRNGLVFCNRKRDAADLARALARDGFSVDALHGDMDQGSRIATLEAFKRGDVRFLVATDVAGRGLDIFGLSHVFNYDVPIRAEDYVHRIGRTGRAGHRGHAITFATEDDERAVRAIEAMIRRPLPVIGGSDMPSPAPSATAALATDVPAVREEPPPRAAEKPAPKRSRGRSDERRAPARERVPVKERAHHHDRTSSDGPVVGMGDHVPAFLLRPTPSVGKATATKDDEDGGDDTKAEAKRKPRRRKAVTS
jgi:superfamily II DNA/RNA helicase